MSTQESSAQVVEEHGVPTDLKRPRPVTVIIVLILFVALLGALFLVGYIPHARENAQIRADARDVANAVPQVGVTKPRQLVSNRDIALPADIRPNQQTAIYPRTNGYLQKLYVDINDRVKEGQLLAEIATPEVDAQLVQSKAALAQARANLVKAQSDMNLAAKTLERYQHLPAGAAAATDVDQRKAAYEDAVSAVEQAKANIGVAEADVQRLTVLQGFEKVTAPFSGVITARNYDVGALLSSTNTGNGREMFDLVQSDTMLVDVNVPQVYASQIKVGEPVELEVRNYPNQTFTGRVYRPAGALNPNTRTMLFELEFPNPDGLLYAGMYGQVRLNISRPNPVLVIPTSAMLFNANGTQVALVQDGKVHFQNIQVGRDLGTEMEVISGIDAGVQVVANPAAQISEGLRVEPRLQQEQGQKTADAQPANRARPTTQPLAQRGLVGRSAER